MSANSTIEWTDATWNPVTGCDRVSAGCDNCYAERIATRFGRPFLGAVKCHSERLWYPQKWRKPRRVFVNSVSDLFHPDVPAAFIAEVFAVMGICQKHTFQVLTKRPQRMAKLLADHGFWALVGAATLPRGVWLPEIGVTLDAHALPNVWLGVSVENQRYADLRIPHLLATPAAVRFLSVEPMLGPVDLDRHMETFAPEDEAIPFGIHWVICGGESGPGARPMHPTWARDLRDECVAAGVPFFFKQWGEWEPVETVYADDRPESAIDDRDEHLVALGNNGSIELDLPRGDGAFGAQPRPELDPWWLARVGKKHAGRVLDGRVWDEYPAEFDDVEVNE